MTEGSVERRSPRNVRRRADGYDDLEPANVEQAALLLAAVEARPWLRLEAAAGDSVTATTSAGAVRGIVDEGINVFKGIPYGDTTAGKNRFMPPKQPAAWKGTRDALTYGPTAPQTVGAVDVRGRAARARLPEEGEDCLVLNVFTPALSGGRNRPVMVWLHGGGFSSGSGSRPILDGTSLARSR